MLFSINSSSGWLVTSGHGVETEVMHRAFQKFTQNHNAYFVEALDDFCTLRSQNPAAAASAVSVQRKTDMKKLGALVALMIVGGWKPGRIDPLFIYLLVHDFDFHSLTPDLVEDWHPALARLIKNWIQVGPEGDIRSFESHLLSYHDIQVCCHYLSTFREKTR